MLDGPFALAIAAGMAATVNPCGFALLPAYLAAFLGEGHTPGASALPRAFAVGGAMTAGFVVVFGLFGAVITPLAASVEQHLPWVTIVIGLALVGLGVALLAGRDLLVRLPKLNKGGRSGSVGSMFLFGISYAVASLSCTIGPFLAVTSTTFRSGDVASGVVVFVAYGAGMGVVVTALTVGAAVARHGLVGRLRSLLPHVSRISGGFLVVAGAYVAWYGWFEIRVFRGGDARDPVISRALEVQRWLQERIVPDEPITALAGLATILAMIAGVGVLRSRRRSAKTALDATGPDPVGGSEERPAGDPVTPPVTR
ncbi:cytochrome c biogenesis CcdA family protein [soil metagenome]